MSDEALAIVIDCFTKPLPLFDDYTDNGSLTPYNTIVAESVAPSLDYTAMDDSELPIHNFSVTDLRLGHNLFGERAAKSLAVMLKNNSLICNLNLDGATGIPATEFHSISTSIRKYNSVLEQLSVSSTELSVKSAESIGRIVDAAGTRIKRLELSGCSLTQIHLDRLCNCLLAATFLTHLGKYERLNVYRLLF